MDVVVAAMDVAVVAMNVAVVALIIFQIAFSKAMGRNVGFIKRRVTCIACAKPLKERIFLEREKPTLKAVVMENSIFGLVSMVSTLGV